MTKSVLFLSIVSFIAISELAFGDYQGRVTNSNQLVTSGSIIYKQQSQPVIKKRPANSRSSVKPINQQQVETRQLDDSYPAEDSYNAFSKSKFDCQQAARLGASRAGCDEYGQSTPEESAGLPIEDKTSVSYCEVQISDSVVHACADDTEEAKRICDENSNPDLQNAKKSANSDPTMSDFAGAAVSTVGGLQAQCNKIGELTSVIGNATEKYISDCNTAKSKAQESCQAMQAEADAKFKPIPTCSEHYQSFSVTVQNNLKEVNALKDIIANARTTLAQTNQMGVDAITCKCASYSGASFNECLSNVCIASPNSLACKMSSGMDCSSPSYSGLAYCICKNNPNSANCKQATTQAAAKTNLAGNGGGSTVMDLSSQSGYDTRTGGKGASSIGGNGMPETGSGKNTIGMLDPSGQNEANKNDQHNSSANSLLNGAGVIGAGGTAGGSAGGVGAEKNQITGSGMRAGAGYQFPSGGARDLNGNVYGSVGYNENRPDLSKFLPQGKYDPRFRGVAGATGIDGITGPNSNIWSKIKNRYQAQESSLLP